MFNQWKERKRFLFFLIEKGEQLNKLYLKIDVISLQCVFEKFVIVSLFEIDINPMYCVSLRGFTLQCGMKYTGINIQTLQGNEINFLLENNIRGGNFISIG